MILHNVATELGRRGTNFDGIQNSVIEGNTIDMGQPTHTLGANTYTPYTMQLSMSDRPVAGVIVRNNVLKDAYSGVVGLSQKNITDVTFTGEDNLCVGVKFNLPPRLPMILGNRQLTLPP